MQGQRSDGIKTVYNAHLQAGIYQSSCLHFHELVNSSFPEILHVCLAKGECFPPRLVIGALDSKHATIMPIALLWDRLREAMRPVRHIQVLTQLILGFILNISSQISQTSAVSSAHGVIVVEALVLDVNDRHAPVSRLVDGNENLVTLQDVAAVLKNSGELCFASPAPNSLQSQGRTQNSGGGTGVTCTNEERGPQL